MLIRVAVNVQIGKDKGFLDYLVPEALQPRAKIGARIQAPLGRGQRQIQGYIIQLATPEEGITYKAITQILDEEPLLDKELVDLSLWVSKRYVCSCYYVLEYILPQYARRQKKVCYRWCGALAPYQNDQELFDVISSPMADFLQKGLRTESELRRKFGSDFQVRLKILEDQQLVERLEQYDKRGSERQVQYYTSLVSAEDLQGERIMALVKRAPKQRELLWYLTYEGAKTSGELRHKWSNVADLLRSLMDKGLVAAENIALQRTGETSQVFVNASEITLNAEQALAVRQMEVWLEEGRYQPALLQGVTGSGKTEVYLRSIEKTLALGKGAMVLVPEIALTPQLIGRFKGRLQSPVEVLHSSLSDGERYDVWQHLRSGEIKVVVGVRSAVFAPVQNLGLIIIDEEHETTFKQSEPEPRYHAREVALKRAQIDQAVVLMGSATPSVETYYKAMNGEYAYLALHNRAKQQPMPEVEIVDMGKAFQNGERSIFSLRLREAMEEHLQRGEQVILFLNRRGFARSVLCRECGYTMTCPKCSIALTYHKQQEVLKCHYCDLLLPVPKQCPKCGSRFIRHFGSGTELVEEELHRLWPWVKVLRMDRDTTQNKNAHQHILEQFASGDAQILVGTQMVTKGLDFPNVTLVGVIAADLTLNLPDYTAAEHCFQLLTQVAGRAGRGDKAGQVIVQTYNPEHYSIRAAKNHDYEAFYEQEIKNRQLMGYPPFTYLVRVLASDFTPDVPKEALSEIARIIGEHYPDIEQLGPSEAPIEKIRDRYRAHLILKDVDLPKLLEAVDCGQKYRNVSRKSKTLRIIIDVEPQSIL